MSILHMGGPVIPRQVCQDLVSGSLTPKMLYDTLLVYTLSCQFVVKVKLQQTDQY